MSDEEFLSQCAQREPNGELTCPVCRTSYDAVDCEPEYTRVKRHVCETSDRLKQIIELRLRIVQARDWLRLGAPGRALAALEGEKMV